MRRSRACATGSDPGPAVGRPRALKHHHTIVAHMGAHCSSALGTASINFTVVSAIISRPIETLWQARLSADLACPAWVMLLLLSRLDLAALFRGPNQEVCALTGVPEARSSHSPSRKCMRSCLNLSTSTSPWSSFVRPMTMCSTPFTTTVVGVA